MMTKNTPERRIASADNVFGIVESIKELDGATPREIASRVDLAPSTVHEYLSTLKYRGYVIERGGEYRLSYQFLTLGGYVRDNEPLYDIAREWIGKLADETGEITAISVEENGKRIAVHLENDQYNIRNTHPLGTQSHLHTNAAGKAILAELSDERIDEIVDEHGLPERTENTITERDRLFDEIEEIRDREYALNLQERRKGWHAVASGINHPQSGTVGAISLAGPTSRLPQEKLENEYAERLLQVRNEIEVEIQFTGD